jgi:hypothetical protein
MDDVSIPLSAGIVDLLVERTAARLRAAVVVAEPWVGIDAAAAHLGHADPPRTEIRIDPRPGVRRSAIARARAPSRSGHAYRSSTIVR